ncbi:hypothetical protein [Pelagibius sp.]|uniref:hypothetical protein n=1 Tax=Pelagibius sp. TaxID=1931238 RepID=UPI00261D923B|nr:hypothetical protein [Pelagibius sp.]
MPKRYLPLFADGDLQSAELLAVRDMSSGKLRIVRALSPARTREAREPEPDLALLTALSRKKPH